MRKMLSFAVGILLGTAGSAVAADNLDKDDFEQRAKQINRAAEKETVFKQALHHVSIETGVPEATVETQHRRNPEMGLTGIMLANVMAAETKQDSSTFIKQRKGGKGWVAIARANNVPLEKLTRRLDNLDRAIGSPNPPRKNDDKVNTEDRQRVRDKQQRRDR